MKTWSVTLPIAGHAFLEVQAETEAAAIEAAMEAVTLSDIEEWEALHQFNKGNVCYCPQPWEPEAEDLGDDEGEDA